MFALPGIIVQNSLFTTLNTATGLSTDLEKGFFDRLRSLPIARFAPLAGRILADIAKQAWAVAMLLAIGALLGFRIGTNPLAVLAAVGLILVSTLALSWALVLVAMLAANPEKVQIFGFVVLFPITFTSDAFVRTASMPGWLQAWSKANPVSLISDAMRGLMVSDPVTRPLVESLLYAVAFTAVFAPLAVRAFRRRV
jgi:oleandomycin transport system permease protein